jgi:hypothetical protein
MDEEDRRGYTSSQFHTDIIALFKRCAMKLDFDMNPLEWDHLPVEIVALMEKLIEAAIEEQSYGPECLEFSVDGELEVSINLSLIEFEDGITSTPKNVSDFLVSRADLYSRDPAVKRDVLVEYLGALEVSIERSKEKAIERGWM